MNPFVSVNMIGKCIYSFVKRFREGGKGDFFYTVVFIVVGGGGKIMFAERILEKGKS